MDELRFRVKDQIATFGFNRPGARNALTIEILTALAEGVQQRAANNDLRVVVIRGPDDHPFSAGYNFDELPRRAISSDEARQLHAPVCAVANAVLDCPHPVIGAARKFVFGAALDIFSHCDLRVCAEATTFCMPPNRFGFLYPTEGIYRLAGVVGLSRATEMFMLGSTIDSEAAWSWGLVQRVFPEQAFEDDLAVLSDDALATNAPLSIRGTKRALIGYRERQGNDDGASKAMYEEIAACLNSNDVPKVAWHFARSVVLASTVDDARRSQRCGQRLRQRRTKKQRLADRLARAMPPAATRTWSTPLHRAFFNVTLRWHATEARSDS